MSKHGKARPAFSVSSASVVFGGIAVIVMVGASAQTAKESVLIDEPVDRDLYVAGADVQVLNTIDGDLVAAGQRVLIEGQITGDLIVAAQEIAVSQAVGDDVRAVGQRVRIEAPVSGHVVAAGQTITVAGQIDDWASIAGRSVEVNGRVGGELAIVASEITINTEVAGNVELVGNSLTLGPEAHVRGDLRWRSDNEADISPQAQIDGEYIEEPSPGYTGDIDSGSGIVFTSGLIIAVAALFLLFPGPLRTTAGRIAARPGASLALGFAVLVSTPILALILLVTGFGFWLGLALGGAYLAALVIGVLAGLFAASDILIHRFLREPNIWQALAAILLTVVAVGLLTSIPYLGKLVVLIVWLLGLGSICWLSWSALRGNRTALETGR